MVAPLSLPRRAANASTAVSAGLRSSVIAVKPAQVSRSMLSAGHVIRRCAERGGIVTLAEIAMRQALDHGRPKPVPAPRKKTANKYKVIR
jgi:hypothetical protein